MDLKTYKFTKDHEWVKEEKGSAVIGITDYAQKELGDVVYVELPAMASHVNAGDACANIQSVKAVSDIYCPVSGEIIETNPELDAHPEKVNQEPYGQGWIFKIKLANPGELNSLMDEQAYENYLKGITQEH